MKSKTLILTLVVMIAATCLALPSLTFADETTNNTVTATSVNYHRVKVAWNEVEGVDGYIISKSADKNIWTKVKTITNNEATEYIVTGLTTRKKMYFKVETYTDTATTKTTATTTKLTKEIAVASATPMLTKAGLKGVVASSNSIKLSWSKVAGAQKYRIYRYDTVTKKCKKIKTTSARTYTNKKLRLGVKYKYIVRACRTVGGKTITSKSLPTTIKTPSKLTWRTAGFKDTNAYKVMKVAKGKLGASYVSGGSGPSCFDCSGYVYWVMKNAKVSSKNISRTSAQGMYSSLRKYSIGRSYKSAQPGDIVFISSSGSKNNVTHVAFYYGDNKLIHATNPSVGVAITNTAWSGGQSKVVGIARVPGL